MSWLVPGLVSLAILLGGAATIIRWRLNVAKLRAEWEPCGPVLVKKTLADKAKVLAATERAITALRLTTWSAQGVLAALQGLHVDIGPTEEWDGVAGQFFPDEQRVLVGPGLAALCHEFGHVVEFHIMGQIDYAHAGWATNGMMAAQAEYTAK